ncbi:hypothetical protein B0H14DRAFT_3453407 [Mycena olivaceomarginata]|nr:hypothetical protein B0H14DRAFT_3453407 [Mycena olivaceomarginata]
MDSTPHPVWAPWNHPDTATLSTYLIGSAKLEDDTAVRGAMLDALPTLLFILLLDFQIPKPELPNFRKVAHNWRPPGLATGVGPATGSTLLSVPTEKAATPPATPLEIVVKPEPKPPKVSTSSNIEVVISHPQDLSLDMPATPNTRSRCNIIPPPSKDVPPDPVNSQVQGFERVGCQCKCTAPPRKGVKVWLEKRAKSEATVYNISDKEHRRRVRRDAAHDFGRRSGPKNPLLQPLLRRLPLGLRRYGKGEWKGKAHTAATDHAGVRADGRGQFHRCSHSVIIDSEGPSVARDTDSSERRFYIYCRAQAPTKAEHAKTALEDAHF